jgi:hypothetical protein
MSDIQEKSFPAASSELTKLFKMFKNEEDSSHDSHGHAPVAHADHGAQFESTSEGLFSFDDESKNSMNAREIADGFRKISRILGRPIRRGTYP